VLSKICAHIAPHSDDGAVCKERRQNTSQVRSVSPITRQCVYGYGLDIGVKGLDNQKSIHHLDTGIRSNRYREGASRQGQEDLDTNQGAAGKKTVRGVLLTQ
jgi:hypothetical protein